MLVNVSSQLSELRAHHAVAWTRGRLERIAGPLESLVQTDGLSPKIRQSLLGSRHLGVLRLQVDQLDEISVQFRLLVND